ncbi:MAG: pyridoxal phosphate-dependent aminotransferase [Mucinivorans sp.]
MPEISKTGQVIPASPIRKLVPFAEEAKRRGIKVYHLNIGQPDIHTPELAMEAIRNLDDKVIEYTHSAGIESYRRALATFYCAQGKMVDYTNIVVTTGGSEAILLSMLAVCNPGDEIIVPEPYYANYNSFAIEAQVKIVPVTSRIEENFALPPIAQLEKLITPATRAILICNPNNPTGYLYSQEEMLSLRDLVLKHDIFLMSDEVYSDFCYDNRVQHSVLSLHGVDKNVILIDSSSKRYSMCGVRVGAVVSRNAEVMDAILRMGQARLCAPYLGQVAAQAALSAPRSYYEDVKAKYVSRRNYMIQALQQMDGVVCPMPCGAFYAIASLPIDNADRFCQWLLEEYSFQGATVMLAPAQGFYSNPQTCPQTEVRLAYVLELDELKVAMKVLSEALKSYSKMI